MIGDEYAFDKITKANLRFVVSVAKQYQNQWLSLSDLINEWNEWLMKAVHRFDVTKWFKFISYAVWWIRQSILQGIAEHSRIVRLPLNKVWDINKMNRASEKFTQMYEREPTTNELADELWVDLDFVDSRVWLRTRRHQSFDSPLTSEGDNTLWDVFRDDSSEGTDYKSDHFDSLKTEIERSLNTLTDRQSEVIKLFFWIWIEYPMSLEDIWERYGLTRERVRQIKDKAIHILRNKDNSVLKEFRV